MAREAAFISAGGYHHHIGLNTWESRGGSPPPPGTTGLFHTAILYPTRPELADALRRVIAAGIPLDGASDHGVSEALYLRDPDQNGVELYWDRPRESWPVNEQGELKMFTRQARSGRFAARAGAGCAFMTTKRCASNNSRIARAHKRHASRYNAVGNRNVSEARIRKPGAILAFGVCLAGVVDV